MLPFLKPKRDPGVLIIKHRTSDVPAGEDSTEDGQELQPIEEGIQDFIRAFNMQDIKRMAQIVKLVHDELHEIMNKEHKENDSEEIV